MGILLSDLRGSIRTLAKTPAFAIISVLVLSIGIAVNTAAFSAVNVLVRQPLPFSNLDRIARLWERSKAGVSLVSYPNFENWKDQSQSYEKMGAAEAHGFNLTGRTEPENIQGAYATSGFLGALGLEPILGRGFLPQEERPGAGRVVLISERLWQARFASDPAIVGRELILDGEPHVVVGVLPRINRSYYASYGIWAPLLSDAKRQDRQARSLQVVGLLRPGVTLDQARAEMNAISTRLAGIHAADRGFDVITAAIADDMRHVVPRYMVLLAAFGLVLLILCSNIASLQLARAASRTKEVAIRLALGASRGRAVWHLLSEGLLLAGVSGTLAIVLTVWVRHVLIASVPELKEITIDGAVLVFTLLISALAGLFSGLSPALSVSKPDLNRVLKSGGGEMSPAGRRMQRALVVSEMALALMLLAGTGLLAKAFLNVRGADTGFRTDNLLALSISLDGRKYMRPELREAFYQQALAHIGTLPGIVSVAGVSPVPLSGGGGTVHVEVEGRPAGEGGNTMAGQYTVVTPNYFRTAGIPLRRGRQVTELDRETAPAVVIINERAAQLLWPGDNPIGKRIRFGGREWRSVIGLTGDARQNLMQPAGPEFYVPHAQDRAAGLSMIIRTKGEPVAATGAIRNAIHSIDPALPIASMQTMNEIISGYFPGALIAGVAGFCGIAVVLAAIGLYGVISYVVTQRTREIGIRMALGARAGDVVRLVVGQGLRLTAVGAAIGLVGAFGLMRVLAGVLFGVSAADPAVLASILLLINVVALAACYFPARRAARVSPITALRYE